MICHMCDERIMPTPENVRHLTKDPYIHDFREWWVNRELFDLLPRHEAWPEGVSKFGQDSLVPALEPGLT